MSVSEDNEPSLNNDSREEEWRTAAESRMSLFRKRLDQGHGPGWKAFWEIKAEAEEVRALRHARLQADHSI